MAQDKAYSSLCLGSSCGQNSMLVTWEYKKKGLDCLLLQIPVHRAWIAEKTQQEHAGTWPALPHRGKRDLLKPHRRSWSSGSGSELCYAADPCKISHRMLIRYLQLPFSVELTSEKIQFRKNFEGGPASDHSLVTSGVELPHDIPHAQPVAALHGKHQHLSTFSPGQGTQQEQQSWEFLQEPLDSHGWCWRSPQQSNVLTCLCHLSYFLSSYSQVHTWHSTLLKLIIAKETHARPGLNFLPRYQRTTFLISSLVTNPCDLLLPPRDRQSSFHKANSVRQRLIPAQ